jgi:diguanylate cyclase (GGDEF)-like protein
LDNCTSEAAMQRAEIIRNGVKAQVVAFGRAQLTVTLSLGVTTYHQGEALDALVARADTALYQAKEEGRDRSVLAG